MIIRFNPQVPAAQQPVQPSGKGFALNTIGKNVAQLGAKLGDIALNELAERRVAEKATAHASALQNVNEFALLFGARSEELRTDATKLGQEEQFFGNAMDLFSEMSDVFLEQYTDLEFNDPNFYATLIESKFFSVKEGLHRTSREMIVAKSLRTYTDSIKALQLEGLDIPIEELAHKFTVLSAIGDDMEDNRVIEFGDNEKIVMNAMVETMASRAARNTEEFGEAAADINAAEALLMRPLMLPLYQSQLTKISRAERVEGRAQLVAQQRAATRQISIGISVLDLSLEEAVKDGIAAEVDPAVIERVYADHHNRQFASVERARVEAKRKTEEFSQDLRADAVESSLQKGFSMSVFLDANRRDLIPQDREFLAKHGRAAQRARRTDVTTDLKTLQELQSLVDADPTGVGVDDAILNACAAELIADKDCKTLVTRHNNNKKSLRTKEVNELKAVHSRGLTVLNDVFRTTGPLNFDPVSQRVEVRVKARLDEAMWRPKSTPGDFELFREDPIGFIHKLAAIGRVELDQAIGEVGVQILQGTRIKKLVFTDGTINTAVIRQALTDKKLTKLDAERLLRTAELILSGKLKLPDGVVPVLPPAPPPPPPPEPSLIEQIIEFGQGLIGIEPDDEGEAPLPAPEAPKSAERSSRVPRRKKNF